MWALRFLLRRRRSKARESRPRLKIAPRTIPAMEPVERRDEWVGCGEGDGVGSSAEGGEGEGVGLSAGSWGVEWIEFSAEG